MTQAELLRVFFIGKTTFAESFFAKMLKFEWTYAKHLRTIVEIFRLIL